MKKKKIIIITVICIVIVAVCAGIFGKKAYDQKQEKLRQEQIEAKLDEIQQMADSFENTEDRTAKLEVLKSVEDTYESYQKEEGAFDECLNFYDKIIADEKQYFEDDYNGTITNNTIEDTSAEIDKDKLNNLVQTLTAFKDSLKTEYESCSTVSEDKFNELNTTIDTLVTSYNDRINAILEEEAKHQAEEARKKAEEEAAAKAKAEEEAAAARKKNSASSNSSSSDSSLKKSSSSSSNNGSSSSNSSSSSKKNNTSSSSGSSSSSSSSSSGNGNWATGWGDGDDGTRHETKVNIDTGDFYVDGKYITNEYDNGYFN